jgi:Holliday junction resolvase RusA-like endonuclease
MGGSLVIAFEVVARPVPQGSLTPVLMGNGRPGVRYLKADELYEWRAAVARACPIELPEPGAFRVSITFHVQRPATVKRALPTVYPDLDKLVRAVLDALTGRVWDDDAQVCELIASKRYATGHLGAEIEIARLEASPVGLWA